MVKERFRDFIHNYKNDDGQPVYWNKTKHMIESDERSLEVDFSDIEIWDPMISGKMLEKPDTAFEQMKKVLKAIVENEEPGYVDKHEDRIYIRVYNLPDRSKRKIRTVRAEDIGKMVAFDAVVTKTTEIKPLLTIARFKCVMCGTEINRMQDGGKYNPPVRCHNEQCNKAGPFKLVTTSSSFMDFQKLIGQERPEDLPAGHMPESFIIYLFDDLVDIVRPGDRVTCTGILRISGGHMMQRGKFAAFGKYLECNSVEKESEDYLSIEITEEDEEKIKELANDKFVHRKLWSSIAPAIHGNEMIKKAISLLMVGGTTKTLEDGTTFRGESNILLIGDPGVGKSKILKHIADLSPRGLYTSGKGISAAGLTAAVLHDPETKELTLEAGALVLADRGICMIDEFDKMDANDRAGLHEAMESHTVSIAKAGIVATLNARCSILAAANPKLGRWDPAKDLRYNLNLPPAIISRFDLIFPLIDDPDEKRDEERATHILTQHQRSALVDEPSVDANFIRKFIAYIRQNCHPKLTDEANKRILEFYLKLRQQSTELRADGKPKSIAITPRQLEAIIRLSEAHAKVALRDKVTYEDAEAAIQLMEDTLRKIATDPDTGEIDVDRVTSGHSSKTRNKVRIVNDIIELLTKEGDAAYIKEIVTKAEEKDLKKEDVEEIIYDLVQNGVYFEPRPGMVKKIG